MEKVNLRLEKWVCDNNEEEVHYFLGSRYVIGYNPKLVHRDAVEMIAWSAEANMEVRRKSRNRNP